MTGFDVIRQIALTGLPAATEMINFLMWTEPIGGQLPCGWLISKEGASHPTHWAAVVEYLVGAPKAIRAPTFSLVGRR